MTDFFDKARSWHERKLPFVLYRKPGGKKAVGIFAEFALEGEGTGFVFAPFSDGKKWILPDSAERMEMDFTPEVSFSESAEPRIDEKAKSEFESLVNKAVAEIRKGSFEKVVLSRTESVSLENFDAFMTFERLAAAYPDAFVYLWYHPETEFWMAATPETLLNADGKNFATMALAGTQKYSGKPDVSWAQKEIQEQQFVTDFIAESLSGIASSLEIDSPYTHRAGNLVHIRTDIKGELKAVSDLANAIAILHPTPAVCGLPKEKSRQFLLANEGYDREYYAGYIGEFNPNGETDLYVNLRCMKVADGKAHLFIGCGITKDSDPESEFFETVNKSLTVRKVLGRF